MDHTVASSPNASQRRAHTARVRSLRKPWSLSAEQITQMTLAEILKHAHLPMRYLRGDSDHEDTTQALDEAVLAQRADCRAIG